MTVHSAPAPQRPWLNSYPPNADWHATIDIVPVHEDLLATCARHPDKVAMEFFGREVTFGTLAERINHLAGAFQRELGVKKGTRVALLMPNAPDLVACYFAVLAAGGTVVNCNPLYSADELEHILANSRTDIVITLDLKVVYDKAVTLARRKLFTRLVVGRFASNLGFPKNLLFPLAKRADLARVEQLPGITTHRLADLEKSGAPFTPVPIDPHKDVAVQQYTGGTTGEPKGAMLSHANIAANVRQIRLWWPEVFQTTSRLIAVLPFFHIFAMTVCMNGALISGVRVAILPRYNEKDFFATVKRERPTVIAAVPTLCTALAHSKRAQNGELSSIQITVSGGAALSEATRKDFAKVNGGRLKEGYGLTEASPVVACTHADMPDKIGSIGQPIPGTDIRIVSVDDPEQEMPRGERGEICVSGPQVMLGYYENDAANKAAFTSDGYLRTGDVGYLDEDGYIFIVDRIKDLIISSGFNAYPRNIEDAIYKHDAIEEACVIGVPDTYRGEAPVAYVKLREGHTLDEAGLTAFLREKLSKMEMPREIIFKDELPKTMIGKLSKKDLRADYEKSHATGAE